VLNRAPIITPAAAVKDVIIGDKCLPPVTKAVGFLSFRNFLRKHAFSRYCWQKIQSSVKRTPQLREEVGRTVSGPVEIDALCDTLVVSEVG
jgi:hypothetical protein